MCRKFPRYEYAYTDLVLGKNKFFIMAIKPPKANHFEQAKSALSI
ncbi:hypothetical protein VIA_004043 [Vibrio orientalis CIP 102891 = ATCC 33934]|uniref:Uncharacterized protein n=1 Tax=Vibrio orientalis CIP 102891 = ATCC 33934 TaxID=675816 RepID=A0ABP2H241_VIBOR|nr:hypothetical protein VIA_004043 [Vibrio orientalis CIP 102891 = ATCC 33934]